MDEGIMARTETRPATSLAATRPRSPSERGDTGAQGGPAVVSALATGTLLIGGAAVWLTLLVATNFSMVVVGLGLLAALAILR
jgi:hypothetical protein